MFGIMGMDAAFLQAACAKKKAEGNELRLIGSLVDPVIYQLSCSGEITVKSYKDGEAVIETYTNLEDTEVSIRADANTEVVIIGNVTKVDISSWGDFVSINTLKCKTLTYLNCANCAGLTALDLSANTALTYIDCADCAGLTALDLSTNTALTYIDCAGCSGLTEIKYPATNEYVSAEIAKAIAEATASDGTIYTDSAADYYSTIADEANAKGWTIEQLP